MALRRYRCAACGNLTRFDVTVTRTTRAFHHFTVGGELVVEDEQVLADSLDEVVCRWCGHGRAVEVIEVERAADGAQPGGRGSSADQAPERAPAR